jgi:16S rRNA G527 N7-methylase RsmG
VLGLSARIFHGRAETLRLQFDCVVLRAVDRMQVAVEAAAPLVRSGGWLVLMTSEGELESLKAAAGPEFCWNKPEKMTGGERRLLAMALRRTVG